MTISICIDCKKEFECNKDRFRLACECNCRCFICYIKYRKYSNEDIKALVLNKNINTEFRPRCWLGFTDLLNSKEIIALLL